MTDRRKREPSRWAASRRHPSSSSGDAETERGLAGLARLRNSTAKEELPERLKALVEKLRRRND